MRHALILLVGICLLISMPVMADQAADEAAIREAVKQVYAAANKHDVKAWIAMATEDVESWNGNLKGKAIFEESYTKAWTREKDMQGKILEEIGVVFVTPDVALYKYRDEISGALDADGKAIPPYKRLVAIVYVKKDGKWLWTTWFARPIEE